MPNSSALRPEDANYLALLDTLKQRIRSAQVKAALAVNQELVLLYWHIGREIIARQQTDGWGTGVIERLSQDLKREFPEMKGFSARNLGYMKAFAAAWPDEPILQQLAAKIPWGQNTLILQKVKDPQQRQWYIQKTIEHGWSRNILSLQIDNNAYGHQSTAITNFERVLPIAQSDLAQELLKDPYNFDFLTLSQDVQERELEQALTERIRDFLLTLGVGFAFVGSQYRLEVEGEDYTLDLLFYHLKLHCYVVIDLKMTEFKPEYAGTMNFYVSAVNHLLADDRMEPTIGIVLCRSKKRTIVEFALETVQNPIGISTYTLRDSLPPELKTSLPTPEQLGMELEAAAAELEQRDSDRS